MGGEDVLWFREDGQLLPGRGGYHDEAPARLRHPIVASLQHAEGHLVQIDIISFRGE